MKQKLFQLSGIVKGHDGINKTSMPFLYDWNKAAAYLES
jgi:hypothetical protein